MPSRKTLNAFTLVEMLVVLAIIAILAGILLPVISRAKAKGNQTVCRNNLHHLAIGFQLYKSESNDQFPAPGSKDKYGPQPEDWIWWQHDRDINKSTWENPKPAMKVQGLDFISLGTGCHPFLLGITVE